MKNIFCKIVGFFVYLLDLNEQIISFMSASLTSPNSFQ